MMTLRCSLPLEKCALRAFLLLELTVALYFMV
jgi:hypothetical protein